jgi:AcrR family transcriptional regulator
MKDKKDIWIKTGYETVAELGFGGLKIEILAKKVGISKSSFYHHFADLDLFVECLLKYHIEQAHIIAPKEQNAKTIDPELIEIILEYKIDLLFNRQLRINQDNERYAETLNTFNQIIGNAFVMVWLKDLNLQLSPQKLAAIFELALENFYLQINKENLNPQWLSTYFDNLKRIVRSFV